MYRASFCAALIFSVIPAVALAQGEARIKVRTACAADIQKFCPNIERGKGQMRACLDQNQTSLSSECDAARAERAAARAKAKS